MQKNRLIKKMGLFSKFLTSRPGKEKIAIHILPNISRIKGNQTMKFGQLIEYNMRNIFLEKPYTKCGEKLFPDSFSKKIKIEDISGLIVYFLYSLFLLYIQLRAIEIY